MWYLETLIFSNYLRDLMIYGKNICFDSSYNISKCINNVSHMVVLINDLFDK